MTGIEHSLLLAATAFAAVAAFAAVLACGPERMRRGGLAEPAQSRTAEADARSTAIRRWLRTRRGRRADRNGARRETIAAHAFAPLPEAFLLAGCNGPPAAAWMVAMRWLTPAAAAAISYPAVRAAALSPLYCLLMALACAAAARAMPHIILAVMINRRRLMMRKALPDAVALMGICLKAGLGLDQALKRTAEAFAPACPALARELNRTAWEMSLLSDRASAFSGLGERIAIPEARALAAQLAQAVRYGLPAAASLQRFAEDMREARLAEAEQRAARLPAVLAVVVVIFFMPGVLLIVAGPGLLRLIGAI